MALFSFLACGIPFIDIVHLTKENLEEGGKVLAYHRQKTGVLIRMEVNQGMRLLIDRYDCPDAHYLFPSCRKMRPTSSINTAWLRKTII